MNFYIFKDYDNIIYFMQDYSREVKVFGYINLIYDFKKWLLDNDYNFEQYNIYKFIEFVENKDQCRTIPIELFVNLEDDDIFLVGYSNPPKKLIKQDFKKLDEEIKQFCLF